MLRFVLRVAGIAAGLTMFHPGSPAVQAADREVSVRQDKVVVKHRRYRERYYGCPDGYGCYPLYGAYGPYGGRAYWSSFSYLVPTYHHRHPY
jgi:hypothetical protein